MRASGAARRSPYRKARHGIAAGRASSDETAAPHGEISRNRGHIRPRSAASRRKKALYRRRRRSPGAAAWARAEESARRARPLSRQAGRLLWHAVFFGSSASIPAFWLRAVETAATKARSPLRGLPI